MSPLGESNWYHLFYTIAYLIAVIIYFALMKKKGAKKPEEKHLVTFDSELRRHKRNKKPLH